MYICIYMHIYIDVYACMYPCIYVLPDICERGCTWVYYVYIQVPWVFFERALKQEFDTLDQDTLNAIKKELDVNANQQIGH